MLILRIVWQILHIFSNLTIFLSLTVSRIAIQLCDYIQGVPGVNVQLTFIIIIPVIFGFRLQINE